MKPGRWAAALVLLAGPAIAQPPANLPAGSPLGTAGDGADAAAAAQAEAAARAQRLVQLRAQAQARSDLQAAFAGPAPAPASPDPGRPRPTGETFGQPAEPAATSSSPAGAYYRITTPWGPR